MSKLSIIELHPFESWDGPAIHVRDLIKGLVEFDHQVCLVTRNWDGINEMESICEVKRLNLRRPQKIDIKFVPLLARIIKENKADIIHTHGGWSSWVALLATTVAGRGRVVNTWHGFRSIKKDPLHRLFYNKIGAIIAVSEMLKKRIIENGYIDRSKVCAVHNGIDIKKFAALPAINIREKYGISTNQFVAGYFGRIHPDKGLEYAIKAIAILKRQGIHVIFMIVGGDNDTQYKKYLQDIISSNDLADNIIFTGFTMDVSSYMHAIDVLILPSVFREPFGLVLCEAMACLKPVITTNTGGQEEIVEDEITGFIVPPQSDKAIADKLAILASDREGCLEKGAKGKLVVEEKFSFSTMARNTIKIFESCK